MRRPTPFLLGSFAITLMVGAPGHAQKGPPTIDEILGVWKARQEKVATARFQLSCKEMIFKGTAGPEKKNKASEPDPPRDYQTDGVGAFLIDGAKTWYSYDRTVWDLVNKKLRPEHYEEAFDGKLFRTLRNPASERHNYPISRVRPAERSESGNLFLLLPLTMTVRGHHPQFPSDLPRYEVTGRTLNVAGRPCVELIYESKTLNQRDKLYLDKDRGYVLVRKVTVAEEVPTWQVDVSYRQDSLVGWLPQSWEYMIRIDNKPSESGRWSVVTYELNGSVAPTEFEFTYTPGTRVLDKSSGQERQYVVQESGEKGKEIPTIQNPTYEDLHQPQPPFPWVLVLSVSAVALLLCLVGFSVWQKRRRKKADLGVSSDNTVS